MLLTCSCRPLSSDVIFPSSCCTFSRSCCNLRDSGQRTPFLIHQWVVGASIWKEKRRLERFTDRLSVLWPCSLIGRRLSPCWPKPPACFLARWPSLHPPGVTSTCSAHICVQLLQEGLVSQTFAVDLMSSPCCNAPGARWCSPGSGAASAAPQLWLHRMTLWTLTGKKKEPQIIVKHTQGFIWNLKSKVNSKTSFWH